MNVESWHRVTSDVWYNCRIKSVLWFIQMERNPVYISAFIALNEGWCLVPWMLSSLSGRQLLVIRKSVIVLTSNGSGDDLLEGSLLSRLISWLILWLKGRCLVRRNALALAVEWDDYRDVWYCSRWIMIVIVIIDDNKIEITIKLQMNTSSVIKLLQISETISS